MGLYTSVKNGTGAGIKPAPQPTPKDNWTCRCGTACRYYWRNCPVCFTSRN